MEIAAVFVKKQVGRMSLGVEEPGVEEGQPGGKTAWNGGNEGRLVSLQA